EGQLPERRDAEAAPGLGEGGVVGLGFVTRGVEPAPHLGDGVGGEQGHGDHPPDDGLRRQPAAALGGAAANCSVRWSWSSNCRIGMRPASLVSGAGETSISTGREGRKSKENSGTGCRLPFKPSEVSPPAARRSLQRVNGKRRVTDRFIPSRRSI